MVKPSYQYKHCTSHFRILVPPLEKGGGFPCVNVHVGYTIWERDREREREWEKTKSFDPRFSIKIKMTSAAAGGERSFMNSYTAQVPCKVLAQTIARSAFTSLWSEQFPKDTHRQSKSNDSDLAQTQSYHYCFSSMLFICITASLFSTPKDCTSSACHPCLRVVGPTNWRNPMKSASCLTQSWVGSI